MSKTQNFTPVKGSHFLSFVQARKYVRQINLKNIKEWQRWRKSKPKFIPFSPEFSYKEHWKGYNDFLGNENIGPGKKKFYSFQNAIKYVHKQKLKSCVEWSAWSKNERPDYIPSDPQLQYPKEWTNWPDWLGFEVGFWSFEKAREFVRRRKFSTHKDYLIWRKANRPKNIPSNPEKIYSKEWQGYKDFFGDDYLNRYLPFKEARTYVRRMKIKSLLKWRKWSKESRPTNIPSNPNSVYSKDFVSWPDWLGKLGKSEGFLPYKEAKKYMYGENLKGHSFWMEWRKTSRPSFIPANPREFYRDEWKGMPDWLGHGIRKFYSYSKASWYVKKQRLKNYEEWKEWRKTKRPHFIPSDPKKIYPKEWNGFRSFLGTENQNKESNFLSYKKARKIVRESNLKTHKDWDQWRKTKRPKNIPSDPVKTYKEKFISWPDWLGKEN